MWLSSLLFVIFVLISSDIIEARRRVKWRSARCQKYESKKPEFSVDGARVSTTKCLEYTWQAKDAIERQRFEKNCNREYGIAGGKATEITKYPHMAALGWKTKNDKWSFLCGGSLISPNFVLTAAHCTNTASCELKSPYPQVVRMGVTNINGGSSFEKPVDKDITRIIAHHKYKSPKKDYDIALIKIDEVKTFSEFVQPACLYNSEDFTNRPLDATGWGLTNKKKSSPILQSAVLDILSSDECHSVLHNRNWKKFQPHQLCAGKIDGSAGTCNGDSGAPLQYRVKNLKDDTHVNVIVGITSFGKKCGNHNQPLGIYVKINYFIEWIERHVWLKNDDK